MLGCTPVGASTACTSALTEGLSRRALGRYEEDDTIVAGTSNSLAVRHTSATPLPPMPSQLGQGLKGRASGMALSIKRCASQAAPTWAEGGRPQRVAAGNVWRHVAARLAGACAVRALPGSGRRAGRP